MLHNDIILEKVPFLMLRFERGMTTSYSELQCVAELSIVMLVMRHYKCICRLPQVNFFLHSGTLEKILLLLFSKIHPLTVCDDTNW